MRPILLLIACGVFANAAESPPRMVASKDAYRLLRSSATTGALPRFPENPESRGRTVKDPPRVRPASVDGVVKAIGEKGLVEISIGHDDGVREGHELILSRGKQDLGRIVIRRTAPDSAVGEIFPKEKRENIKTGDNVRQGK